MDLKLQSNIIIDSEKEEQVKNKTLKNYRSFLLEYIFLKSVIIMIILFFQMKYFAEIKRISRDIFNASFIRYDDDNFNLNESESNFISLLIDDVDAILCRKLSS